MFEEYVSNPETLHVKRWDGEEGELTAWLTHHGYIWRIQVPEEGEEETYYDYDSVGPDNPKTIPARKVLTILGPLPRDSTQLVEGEYLCRQQVDPKLTAAGLPKRLRKRNEFFTTSEIHLLGGFSKAVDITA